LRDHYGGVPICRSGVVQITSNLFSGFREYNIPLSDSDVIRYEGTLPMYQSIMKPYIIFTVDKRLIRRRI